jgi:hypothetical protein
VVASALFLATGTACSVPGSATTVTGSGNVVTRRFEVDPFSQLRVSHAFVVSVTRGAVAPVVVRIDDNLVDVLDVSTSGGVLRIGLRPGTSTTNATLEADVTAPSLDGIDASGAASIASADPIEGASLSIALSGASRLTAPLVITEGDVELSGASEVTFSGSASRLRVTASGASLMRAPDLSVTELAIELSGASRAEVGPVDTLSAGASGASHLSYGGSPTITRSETSGASTIEPRA